MRGGVDGLHADGYGCVDIFEAVVEEEDNFRCGTEAFGGVEVEGGFGFGEIDGVRPGVVVEGIDPLVTGSEAGFDGVGHVGEAAGPQGRARGVASPVWR